MDFRIQTVEPLYTLPDTIRTEFTHNFWVSALWNQIMGDQTLADVVASLFTGVATALQRVKDRLSKAWDGIVAAGEYVGKTVISTLFASLARMVNLVLAAQVMTFDKASGDLTLLGINADGTVSFDFLRSQLTIGLGAQGTELSIPFLGSIMHIDPIGGGYVETLGVDDLIGTLVLNVLTKLVFGATNVIPDFLIGIAIRSLLASGSIDKALVMTVGYTLLSSLMLSFLFSLAILNKPASAMSMEELYVAREMSWLSATFYFGVSLAMVILLGLMIGNVISYKGIALTAIFGIIIAESTGKDLSDVLDVVTGDFSSLFNIAFKNNSNRYDSIGGRITTTSSMILGVLIGFVIGGTITGSDDLYSFLQEKPSDLTRKTNLATLPLILVFLSKYLLLYTLFTRTTDYFDEEIGRR